MPDTKFYCLHCGQHLEAPADMAGEAVTCPSCNSSLVVPGQPALPMSPAPATRKLQVPREVLRNGPLYSGFWRRALANVVDTSLVDAASNVIMLAVGPAIVAILPGATVLAILIPVIVVRLCLLNWFYFAFMESSRHQATIGKQLFGIIVQDVEGSRISFWRASARYFAPTLLAIPLFIAFLVQLVTMDFKFSVLIGFSLLPAGGGLMILLTQRRQAFHDLFTRCVVVHQCPDTAKLHNLSPWLTALTITGVMVCWTTTFMYNNTKFMPNETEVLRFALSLLSSLFVYGLPIFLLVLIVKIVRTRRKRRRNVPAHGTL